MRLLPLWGTERPENKYGNSWINSSRERIIGKSKISQGWFRHFNESQPQLSVRKCDHTAFLCIDARYKEGFGLPDPRYLAWLKVNHPTEPCQKLCQFFPDALPLNPVDINDSNVECNSTNFQSGVTLGFTPTCVATHSTDHEISEVSPTITEVSQSSTSTLTVDHSIDSPLSTAQQPGFSNTSNCDTSIVSTALTPVSASNTSSANLTSPLSKFLVQYVAPIPEKRAATSTRVTVARVLTSSEGYEMLCAKEEKKKKRKKEKERMTWKRKRKRWNH